MGADQDLRPALRLYGNLFFGVRTRNYSQKGFVAEKACVCAKRYEIEGHGDEGAKLVTANKHRLGCLQLHPHDAKTCARPYPQSALKLQTAQKTHGKNDTDGFFR